ncbi:uncharacterized protein LOC134192756 [Corticium candelabrum]|uniref:uncharacterized protein LOC134192756 n=1 Tax=Corticium candelabrum TaxID=121492 RepID=UPI002E25A54E|nr:uncharacterized protein LOC134192756 [Corticium candelabrum]
MTQTTPQWEYRHFVLVNAVPLIVVGGLAFCLGVLWILFRWRGWCCDCRQWLYDNVVKEAVLFVFKDILKETGSQEGVENDDQQLEFKDVGVHQDKKSQTIQFLFLVLTSAIFFAITAFWDILLFIETAKSVCVFGLACFLDDDNLTFTSKPVECHCTTLAPSCDEDSSNGTTLRCFELVLDYPVAAGVATGLYTLTMFIITLGFALFFKIWKKTERLLWIVQVIFSILLFGLVNVVLYVSAVYDFMSKDLQNSLQFFAGYWAFNVSLWFPYEYVLKRPSSNAERNILLGNPQQGNDGINSVRYGTGNT